MPMRVFGNLCRSLAVLSSIAFLPAQGSAQSPSIQFSRHAMPRSAPTVPLSAGSWSQVAELVSSPSQPLFPLNILFGSLVAISGNTIAVSTQAALIEPYNAAWILEKPANGWANMAPQAALSIPQDAGGIAGLAINGNTAAVCTTTAVYLYIEPASGWTNMGPTATLTTTDGVGCQIVYGTLSMTSDTIVIGAEDVNSYTGAAYVFVKPTGGWSDMTQTAKLTASNAKQLAAFGASTGISGDTIAVGSPGAGAHGLGYIFVKPPSGWADMTETAQLTTPSAPLKSGVGSGIAISGNTVLVGSSNGSAYIFVEPSGGWKTTTATATLTPADNAISAGFSVALSGNIAVLGASNRGNGQNSENGGLYVFTEPKSGWKNMSGNILLTGSNAHYFSRFGTSLAVQGNLIIGGAPFTMNWAGSAYIFELQSN